MTTAALMLFPVKRWFTEASLPPAGRPGITQSALSAVLTVLGGVLAKEGVWLFLSVPCNGPGVSLPPGAEHCPVERPLVDTGIPETVGACFSVVGVPASNP